MKKQLTTIKNNLSNYTIIACFRRSYLTLCLWSSDPIYFHIYRQYIPYAHPDGHLQDRTRDVLQTLPGTRPRPPRHHPPQGANSREVYTAVNQQTNISRASIINFLNAAADDGILTFIEKSGKGGYHRVYTLAYPNERLKTYLTEQVISFLKRKHPEEAGKVLAGV